MKSPLSIFVLCLFLEKAYSQSTAGITGQPDTSFSVYSEYKKNLKDHPDIRQVDEWHSPAVAEEKNIMYCSVGPRKLLLDVFCPRQKSAAKRTAIIILHGGGWRSGNRSIHYPLAERLAALGYVCFTPEYRLSTEALYPAAVYDIKAAISWVREKAKKYRIDTSRIVVAGHSSGGELAAFMGSTNGNTSFEGHACHKKYSSRVNAVVDMDGILAFIHPESGEGDDSKKTSAATNWLGYSKTENPGLWQQASPLSYAGPGSVPILFLNSSVARMHAGRDDYIKILDRYHIYSSVMTFEGAPHSFCLFQPWFDPVVKAIDDFLQKLFKK